MKERLGPSNRRAHWETGQERRKGLERKRRLSKLRGAAFALMSMIPPSVAQDLTDVLKHEPPKLEFVSHQPEKPKSIEGVIITAEKQKALDNAIAAIQKNLQDPKVLEALDGKGEHPLSVILSAIEAPIQGENLEGTAQDVTDLHLQYPIQVKAKGGEGNGVLLRDVNTLLTVAHLVYGKDTSLYPIPEIDVGTLGVESSLAAQNPEKRIITDSLDLTDADIHGELVSIVGIDRDETSDPNGHKTYPGIAIRISPDLARVLSGGAEYIEKEYRESIMIILPSGEARLSPSRAMSSSQASKREQRQVRAVGMSGSPMFVWHQGEYVFGGVFWGVVSAVDSVSQRTVDLGFVHGNDEINRVLEEIEITP